MFPSDRRPAPSRVGVAPFGQVMVAVAAFTEPVQPEEVPEKVSIPASVSGSVAVVTTVKSAAVPVGAAAIWVLATIEIIGAAPSTPVPAAAVVVSAARRPGPGPRAGSSGYAFVLLVRFLVEALPHLLPVRRAAASLSLAKRSIQRVELRLLGPVGAVLQEVGVDQVTPLGLPGLRGCPRAI